MMNYAKYFGLTLLLTGLLFSCQKDDQGPASLELQFGVKTNVLNYRSPGDLQFTSGFITIVEVQFSADKVGGGSVSEERSGVVIYDFATGQSMPASNTFDIPAGEYKDIYLGVELCDENDRPTLVIEGTYEKQVDSTVYPLRFEFNSGEVFEAEVASATLPNDEPAIAKITFDPHRWFAAVSFDLLEAATVNAQGVIVISESSNEQIFDLVADGLDLATEAVFE